jgi:hypothetical protein
MNLLIAPSIARKEGDPLCNDLFIISSNLTVHCRSQTQEFHGISGIYSRFPQWT